MSECAAPFSTEPFIATAFLPAEPTPATPVTALLPPVEFARGVAAVPERASVPTRIRRRVGTMLLALATTAGLAAGTSGDSLSASPAQAAESSVMPVAVAHTAGDGVWLRSGPTTAHAKQRLMYDGETFRADCFAYGTPVPSTDAKLPPNPVWLHGTHQSGERGSFSDVFSNTTWSRNNTLVQQGLPECDSEQTTPHGAPDIPETNPPHEPSIPQERTADHPTYTSVFYAPGDGETVWYNHRNASMPTPPGVYVLAKEGNKHPRWSSNERCNPENANAFSFSTRPSIKTLGAWSIGRLGPPYFFSQATLEEKLQIDHVLLIDPGSYGENTQAIFVIRE